MLRPLAPHSETVLAEAARIVSGERAADYGDAQASFERIAALWSAVLGHRVTAKEVALCLIQLKVSRACTSEKRDNWVDIAGYAQLGSMLNVQAVPAAAGDSELTQEPCPPLGTSE